jgi:hypothetical protein
VSTIKHAVEIDGDGLGLSSALAAAAGLWSAEVAEPTCRRAPCSSRMGVRAGERNELAPANPFRGRRRAPGGVRQR